MRIAATRNKTWKAAIVALLFASALLPPVDLQAQADPYTLTFQAFAGATQTHIAITISASSGFSLPTVAEKIVVKALRPNGSVDRIVQYTDVELVVGQVVVPFSVVAADTSLMVQVNFKTADSSRNFVLRADTIVVSTVDVAIDNVSAPAQVSEHTPFNVTVSVKELSGNAGAAFDLRILIQNPGSPSGAVENPGGIVGSLTGQSVGPGGTVILVVPCEVSVIGNNATYAASALLSNVMPNDAVSANNSLGFSIDIACDVGDIDCGD